MSAYYKVIAENRKARFDYTILEVFKVGLVLTGNEVKAVRLGRVNLQDSFGRIEKGEVWLYGIHITPYQTTDISKTNPTRPRKALVQKNELVKLSGKVAEKGLTLVPLKLYFAGDWAKVDLALAKAKKVFEKRDKIKRRESEREIERAFRGERNAGKG
ncbi:MAG: SsrA-binding protein SmpB [Candidatus Margulisiibacteriota bacterium]